MSIEFQKAEAVSTETKEEKIARLRAELAALEASEKSAYSREAFEDAEIDELVSNVGSEEERVALEKQKTLVEKAHEEALAENMARDAAELAATRERLGMPPQESAPADSERTQALGKQLESLKATGDKSAERLRNIFNEVNNNPGLFEGNSERSKEFMDRIVEKAKELKSGPELIQEKQKFWEKWKLGSILAGGASIVGIVGGAAWSAKYGFDHTMMVDVLGHSLNGPMIAEVIGGSLSIGSAGIAKLMEVLRRDKSYKLGRDLKLNNI